MIMLDETGKSFIKSAYRIGKEVLNASANDVDKNARFPFEAIEAMKEEGLLSTYIPIEFGGGGGSISDLVAITETFARYCSASAMIWAMHQIQIASIVHHGLSNDYFVKLLKEIKDKKLLLASITSEEGIGGDLESSIAALNRKGNLVNLQKSASTISYGEYADVFLATARKSQESASSDQVLVAFKRNQAQLVKTTNWDSLGMRGTCSPGFHVSADFSVDSILPIPFQEISSQTMVPVSHILWSACWLGIAGDAINRAKKYIQKKARSNPSANQSINNKLVESIKQLSLLRNNLTKHVNLYEETINNPKLIKETLSSINYTLEINNLKITSSELANNIVQNALSICGITGYLNDSSISLSRHLRDIASAGIMINNDRLTKTNSRLLLLIKNE